MEKKWEAMSKGQSLEKQWHKLYKRTKPIRAKGKAIWKGGFGMSYKKLRDIFDKLKIKSVLDCGCADHHWLSKFDWTGIEYMGIDIVPELIGQNKKNFPDKTFINANIVEYNLPKIDLIFIRDVFTHLRLKDCLQIVENVINSGSKYLMISSSSGNINHNSRCLVLNPRNLKIDPFNFPEPIHSIKDKGKEGYYMGVWRVDELSKII